MTISTFLILSPINDNTDENSTSDNGLHTNNYKLISLTDCRDAFPTMSIEDRDRYLYLSVMTEHEGNCANMIQNDKRFQLSSSHSMIGKQLYRCLILGCKRSSV